MSMNSKEIDSKVIKKDPHFSDNLKDGWGGQFIKKMGGSSVKAKDKIYDDGTQAYSKKLNEYVTVKKYDADEKDPMGGKYTCSYPKYENGVFVSSEDVELPRQDVVKFISVRVNMMSNTKYTDGLKGAQECSFKININDKVSKVQQLAAADIEAEKIGGFIQTKGKLLENIDDVTFYKMLIKNNQLLSLVYEDAGGSFAPATKWFRFKNVRPERSFSMSTDSANWDAISY